jgi:hypothetical protein
MNLKQFQTSQKNNISKSPKILMEIFGESVKDQIYLRNKFKSKNFKSLNQENVHPNKQNYFKKVLQTKVCHAIM